MTEYFLKSYYKEINECFLNTTHFEILYILINYANSDTLKTIYYFISKLIDPDYGTKRYYSDYALDYDIQDNYGYFLLILGLGNQTKPNKGINEFNNMRTILINLLTIVDYIRSNFVCFNTKNKQVNFKRIENLVKLIISEKEFFIWYANSNPQIQYYDLESLKETDFELFGDIKTKSIISDNYHTYLADDFGKVLVENGVRKLQDQPSFNRFKTIYIALSNALKSCKNRRLDYCPWCNPDELLSHTKRQRKIDICKDISEFIVKYSDYSSKNLNNHIRSIKSKDNDIDKTRLLRGKELLRILKTIDDNMLRNEKIMPNSFAKIVNMVELQYGYYSSEYFSFE